MHAHDVEQPSQEIKRIRRRGASRRLNLHSDLWVDNRTLKLPTSAVYMLMAHDAESACVTLLLALQIWNSQRDIPDDISSWSPQEISRFFGRRPSSRVIRRLYGKCVDEARRLVLYQRAPFCEGAHNWVYRKCNGKCHHCGIALDPDTFHIDHIVPIKQGGLSHNDNLVAACPPCNWSKGGR